jgi:hypothetical protein
MTKRTELARLVKTLSEAEVHTVLKFVQFLEEGHIRPRVGDASELMKQARVIIDDIVEVFEPAEAAPPERKGIPILEGAIAVPRSEWAVTLDGYSHMFHDLDCHLWVQEADGQARTIAREMPLGQIYLDQKGSERDGVQVALNHAGTVYDDFRFMHRIGEPEAIYVRDAAKDDMVDLIVESKGRFTVLETSIPHSPEPGLRRLAFLGLIKKRAAAAGARG